MWKSSILNQVHIFDNIAFVIVMVESVKGNKCLGLDQKKNSKTWSLHCGQIQGKHFHFQKHAFFTWDHTVNSIFET